MIRFVKETFEPKLLGGVTSVWVIKFGRFGIGWATIVRDFGEPQPMRNLVMGLCVTLDRKPAPAGEAGR